MHHMSLISSQISSAALRLEMHSEGSACPPQFSFASRWHAVVQVVG